MPVGQAEHALGGTQPVERVLGEQPGDDLLTRRAGRGGLAAGTEASQVRPPAGDGGAAAFLRGPASFANVIPLPGTITSDAVTAAEVTP